MLSESSKPKCLYLSKSLPYVIIYPLFPTIMARHRAKACSYFCSLLLRLLGTFAFVQYSYSGSALFLLLLLMLSPYLLLINLLLINSGSSCKVALRLAHEAKLRWGNRGQACLLLVLWSSADSLAGLLANSLARNLARAIR